MPQLIKPESTFIYSTRTSVYMVFYHSEIVHSHPDQGQPPKSETTIQIRDNLLEQGQPFGPQTIIQIKDNHLDQKSHLDYEPSRGSETTIWNMDKYPGQLLDQGQPSRSGWLFSHQDQAEQQDQEQRATFFRRFGAVASLG